ncbi:777_t:CDS:1, partial [Acaulospora morrowiae]
EKLWIPVCCCDEVKTFKHKKEDNDERQIKIRHEMRGVMTKPREIFFL